MAAMSLKPRASAFQPTSRAVWVERRKWTSLDQQVGGEQQVLGGAARTEDGAVVADAHDRFASARQLHPPPDRVQPVPFAPRRRPMLDHRFAF
jgi:hypothetical protein